MPATIEPSESTMADKPATALTEVEDRFISLWGDISALWGVNRSVGRIHALLFLSRQPLDMETITERLQISHGNCSTSIRDLLAWNSIRRVHVPGERRVLYESEQDPWTWFHACIRERRRREVVPVIDQLHEISDHAKTTAEVADAKRSADAKDLKQAHERIARFTKFMDEFKDLIDAFLAVGAGPMGKALRMAAKVLPKGK